MQLYHKAKPGTYLNYGSDDEDDLRNMLRGTKPIRFDLENKWLRGD